MPTKKEIEGLKKALAELDKQLDAEYAEAVRAFEKMLAEGKDVHGIDEDEEE